MLPEVKVFLDSVDAAKAKYDEEYDKVIADRRAGKLDHDEYWIARDDVFRKRKQTQDEAWRVLNESTEDALVKFIAENCADDYTSQAIMVLKILPATQQQLMSLASDEDWCGEWDSLYERAVDAGVVPGVSMPSAGVKALKYWLTNSYGMGRPSIRRIMMFVDEIVQETLAAEMTSTEQK